MVYIFTTIGSSANLYFSPIIAQVLNYFYLTLVSNIKLVF